MVDPKIKKYLNYIKGSKCFKVTKVPESHSPKVPKSQRLSGAP
jgi:hypothetical protein